MGLESNKVNRQKFYENKIQQNIVTKLNAIRVQANCCGLKSCWMHQRANSLCSQDAAWIVVFGETMAAVV